MRHRDYVNAGARGSNCNIIYADDCTVDSVLQLMGVRSLFKNAKPFQQRDRNGIVYGPIRANSFKPRRFR